MSDMIYTLQDFMTHTKGVVYILAVSYLIGFTAFWCFLFRRDKKED
ncbi:MAG: hmc operon protein 4 [candidate division Zixibacteria bacterium]|nr:hmc operon protein 4 [candidate division Zixibacteria bacterium]